MYIHYGKAYTPTSLEPIYVDLDGHKIERTPERFPYNHDTYLLYKHIDFNRSESYTGVYSDRMMGWDFNKFEECCQKVFGDKGQSFDNRKPEDIEVFLNKYFDNCNNRIRLMAVLRGCHHGNGNPLWVFLYKVV